MQETKQHKYGQSWFDYTFTANFYHTHDGKLLFINYDDCPSDELNQIIEYLKKLNQFIFYKQGCNKERFNPLKYELENLKPDNVYCIDFKLNFDRKKETLDSIELCDVIKY